MIVTLIILGIYCLISFIDGCISAESNGMYKGTSFLSQFIQNNPFYGIGYFLCKSRHPWESEYWSDSVYRKRMGLPENTATYESNGRQGRKL
jgi:hypothetical protein